MKGIYVMGLIIMLHHIVFVPFFIIIFFFHLNISYMAFVTFLVNVMG